MRVNKEKEKMAYFMIIKQNCFVKKNPKQFQNLNYF